MPRHFPNAVKDVKGTVKHLLVGGVAVINVGASTETEMKEKKARVGDALTVARVAMKEGIVPGGGVARCAAWWRSTI